MSLQSDSAGADQEAMGVTRAALATAAAATAGPSAPAHHASPANGPVSSTAAPTGASPLTPAVAAGFQFDAPGAPCRTPGCAWRLSQSAAISFSCGLVATTGSQRLEHHTALITLERLSATILLQIRRSLACIGCPAARRRHVFTAAGGGSAPGEEAAAQRGLADRMQVEEAEQRPPSAAGAGALGPGRSGGWRSSWGGLSAGEVQRPGGWNPQVPTLLSSLPPASVVRPPGQVST